MYVGVCMYFYIYMYITMYVYTCVHIYFYLYMYVYMYIYIYAYMCHTGVVYNNITMMFVLWPSSIDNKVGLVQFANVYLRYQSVMICRKWLYSLS